MTATEQGGAVLIIGYGNTLRGDDGLGLLAAERLMGLELPAGVRVMARHQLARELAEDIANAGVVIFLDARAGSPPGQIDYTELEPARGKPGPLEHHVEPGVLLAAAEAIYGATPRAFLLTVRSDSFEPGAPLSEAGEASLPELVERALRLAREHAA